MRENPPSPPVPFAVPNKFPLHACDKDAQRILPPVWCRRIPASQNAAQRILRGSKAKQESCGESPNQPDRLTNFNPTLLCKLHEVRRNEHFPLAFLFAVWYCTTSKGVRFSEHPDHRSKGGEGSRNGTIPMLTSSQHEKAAVDVGASAAAEQRSAIMSCAFP